MPSHAAVSAPTPTLSPREAPSLNANKSRDRDATRQTRAITHAANDALPARATPALWDNKGTPQESSHPLSIHNEAQHTPLRPPPRPNQHIRYYTRCLADPVTHLRPPPWPNEHCHCCQTPSHPIPYIPHLRPLPWPPPPDIFNCHQIQSHGCHIRLRAKPLTDITLHLVLFSLFFLSCPVWSVRGRAGKLGCPQPPKFPSWRGAPVTGSPDVSDPIA